MNSQSSTFHQAFEDLRRQGVALAERVTQWFRHAEPWKAVLAAVVCVSLCLALVPILAGLIVLALVIACVVGWVHEFGVLMRLPASAFPGKKDRGWWILAMLALPPVAFIAFWVYRHSEWHDGMPETVAPAKDTTTPWDSEGCL
jgi:H+/Cl- antiporter ClcA